MKSVVKFAGWVVGVVIVVLDLVAYLGMPWTPDLSNPRDKWALFCISIATFAACFAAGWYQRGQKDMDEIQPLNDQLAGKQAAIDNERRKNAKLAAILDERKRQEREQAQRNSLREWAAALDADSKMLLLETERKGGDVARIPANYDVLELRENLSFKGEPAVLLSHIGNLDDGRRVYHVSINDFGKRVVSECRDILAEAEEYEEFQKQSQNPS